MTENAIVPTNESGAQRFAASSPSLSLALIPPKAQGPLMRMFADPRVLDKQERADLVKRLRECIAEHPTNSDLRVVLGMALCVDLQPQAAIDELAEAVALAPDSFIAHLKTGELWMRLRVMTKAEDHTRRASLLAQNLAQAEFARRQAATIRTMRREGIERSGYRTPWLSIGRLKLLWRRYRGGKSEALATADLV